MNIEYQYNIGFSPSAPVINIDVSGQIKIEQGIKCQIDTGADMTIIPERTISSLGLTPIGIISLEDFRGILQDHLVYRVKIFLCNSEFEVNVIGGPNDMGLIGRDILNQLVILLNGPREQFNITKKIWKLWNLWITKV